MTPSLRSALLAVLLIVGMTPALALPLASNVPGGIAPLDRDAVADEIVKLPVVLDERAGEVHPRERLDGLLADGLGQVGIKPPHGDAQVAIVVQCSRDQLLQYRFVVFD